MHNTSPPLKVVAAFAIAVLPSLLHVLTQAQMAFQPQSFQQTTTFCVKQWSAQNADCCSCPCPGRLRPRQNRICISTIIQRADHKRGVSCLVEVLTRGVAARCRLEHGGGSGAACRTNPQGRKPAEPKRAGMVQLQYGHLEATGTTGPAGCGMTVPQKPWIGWGLN